MDIIRALYLDNKLNVKKVIEKIPTYQVIKEYAKRNPLQIVKNISTCLSKVSITASVVEGTAKGVIKLLNDFQDFEEELNSEHQDDESELGKYVSNFKQNRSSFIENNIITEMIVRQLANIKSASEKENVLVIEDLDRLDPEHIFRILNVLSAHQVGDSSNKFGFDKVVLVCDLNNIEKVYKHFYGQDTEFYGYINKFYSFVPFHFDNRKAIISHLGAVMSVNLPPSAFDTLVKLFTIFIKDNVISLRKILQINFIPSRTSMDFSYLTLTSDQYVRVKSYFPFILNPKIAINKRDLPVIDMLRVLVCLFDGYDNLDKILTGYFDKKYSLSKEVQSKIYPLLAVNNYFITSFVDGSLLFMQDPNQRPPRVPARCSFNGKNYFVHYKWKESQQYDGTESFYNNLRVEAVPSEGNDNIITLDAVCKDLHRSLTLFRSKDYFDSE